MKKNNVIIFFILILMVFLSPLNLSIFQNNNESFSGEERIITETEGNFIKTSDIAGSDLYAESINAFVAGNKSIIKQSLFTNYIML